MGLAEDVEEAFSLLADKGGIRIRAEIEDEDGRIINPRHIGGYLIVQFGVAAESEVDYLPAKPAFQDIGVGHARPRCTTTLKDAGAVHDDRSFRIKGP